jgi:hypothetical protein
MDVREWKNEKVRSNVKIESTEDLWYIISYRDGELELMVTLQFSPIRSALPDALSTARAEHTTHTPRLPGASFRPTFSAALPLSVSGERDREN